MDYDELEKSVDAMKRAFPMMIDIIIHGVKHEYLTEQDVHDFASSIQKMNDIAVRAGEISRLEWSMHAPQAAPLKGVA